MSQPADKPRNARSEYVSRVGTADHGSAQSKQVRVDGVEDSVRWLTRKNLPPG